MPCQNESSGFRYSMACIWRSEDNFWELALSFHCMGPRDWTWFVKLGSKPLSYLSRPRGGFRRHISIPIMWLSSLCGYACLLLWSHYSQWYKLLVKLSSLLLHTENGKFRIIPNDFSLNDLVFLFMFMDHWLGKYTNWGGVCFIKKLKWFNDPLFNFDSRFWIKNNGMPVFRKLCAGPACSRPAHQLHATHTLVSVSPFQNHKLFTSGTKKNIHPVIYFYGS